MLPIVIRVLSSGESKLRRLICRRKTNLTTVFPFIIIFYRFPQPLRFQFSVTNFLGWRFSELLFECRIFSGTLGSQAPDSRGRMDGDVADAAGYLDAMDFGLSS
jgi:hypothetical protein